MYIIFNLIATYDMIWFESVVWKNSQQALK